MVSKFTDALLAASPAIPGLDSTIVIPARRLHFTLGVMSLDLEPAGTGLAPDSTRRLPRTLDAARGLLQEIKPKIAGLLCEEKLRVSLDSMDIMKPERGEQGRAHVMWIGPAYGERTRKFREVTSTYDFALHERTLSC